VHDTPRRCIEDRQVHRLCLARRACLHTQMCQAKGNSRRGGRDDQAREHFVMNASQRALAGPVAGARQRGVYTAQRKAASTTRQPMYADMAAWLRTATPDRTAAARGMMLLLFVAAAIALNAAGGWLGGQMEMTHRPLNSDGARLALIALAIIYVLLMALPFVPGIELGLALMLLLGDGGIALVYLCTQFALTLSFIAGRWLPLSLLSAALQALHLRRASHVLARIQSLAPDQRMGWLTERLPTAWGRRALKHRHLTLAVLLNLPGNAIVGGAGGLALIAGASRLYSLPRFCLLTAAATSPLPLLLWLRSAMAAG
jgi:hypothetical protein